MNRVQRLKIILWSVLGLAAAVGVTRFLFGLGATTNLTDATPWGIWIGFDVMAGVALAAGGFVITAIFYIFRREEFHPLVKPAVLTAFLGYMAVVAGLMFDLGLPWNIWHMMIFWNPHSPLFEVGWCVMLYTTVLILEFSPVPLEEFSQYAKIRSFLMRFRFPLILLGIMLSTLHQSSLGSLFLIMPFKIHPLWYSEIIPILFFISAVALGLMMVAFESLISHWLYNRKPATQLVSKLGKFAVTVLGIYFIAKIADIAIAGELPLIFDGSWESVLFISEMLISILIPMFIFAVPALRNKTKWQWVGSSMVVFGMIFNRLNVGGITMLRTTGDGYIPSWMEISISLGVVSGAVLVFLFAIERFKIWDHRPGDPEKEPHTLPRFDFSSDVWLGQPGVASRTKYSLAFILMFALGFSMMPDHKIHSQGITEIYAKSSSGYDIQYIDGNRDQFGVSFPHKSHIERIGNESCIKCHHINLPRSSENGCWECHKSMYAPNDFFRHDWHGSAEGAKIRCDQCHTPGMTRTAESAKQCIECHPDLTILNTENNYMAISYTDAMHQLCVSCHTVKAAELADMPDLARCSSCHETELPEKLGSNLKWETDMPHFNRVILPKIKIEEPDEPVQ